MAKTDAKKKKKTKIFVPRVEGLTHLVRWNSSCKFAKKKLACFHIHDPLGWFGNFVNPAPTAATVGSRVGIWQMVGGAFTLGDENLWRFEICHFETFVIS